jgi:hypothetical protein
MEQTMEPTGMEVERRAMKSNARMRQGKSKEDPMMA